MDDGVMQGQPGSASGPDEGTAASPGGRLDRRTVLVAGAVAALASPFAGHLLAPSRTSTAAAAAPDPAVVGSWSAPFDMGGVAIHATLTHVGDVFFFGRIEGKRGVDRTSYAATWNYRTGQARVAPIPYDRDVFCAGNNVLPDGRVFMGGGHDHSASGPIGVAENDTYDPVTRTWQRRPPLTQKRWYPTTVGLADGRVLVFGGQEKGGRMANTVDEYDPVADRITRLPTSATRNVGLYPRMHLLPNGRILKTGPSRATTVFNPSTRTWASYASMVYGNRWRGNSLLLPGATRVLTVGGHTSSTSGPTATAEILDTSAARPRWQSTGSLTYPRLLANTVLLPDGQVMVIGGGAKWEYLNPVRTPEMWNPATGRWTPLAPQMAGRMYHATALLLPDGRVLSAGQDNGGLANFGEIYSPPYLFKGPRPTITSAPSTAGYRQQLTIRTPEAAGIGTVVLIRPGSVTHQIDTDQRSVPLTFTAGAGTLTATAPADANLAPPGYYMLFVVDRNGVPSVATWVRLG